MPRLLAVTLALALAIPAAPAFAAPMRSHAGPYEVQVLVEGHPARTFAQRGDTWILGQLGSRYTLRIYNRSGRRIEAVVSVDGRDVIDGLPGDAQKRGYLVPAYGSVDIDGWRISQSQAAAFRFSAVENSYAAQTGSGREVGVIGVAVFEEKRLPPPPPRRIVANPPEYPYSCCYGRNDGYSQPGSMGAGGKGDAPSDSLSMRDEKAPASPVPTTSAPAQPSSAPPPSMSKSAAADGPSSPSMDNQGLAQHGTIGGAMGGGDYREQEPAKKKERSGLGTEYGESVDSRIVEVQFERQSSRPSLVLGLHYNDREGLLAMGIDVDGTSEQAVRQSADPFPVVDRGFAAPPPGWNR